MVMKRVCAAVLVLLCVLGFHYYLRQRNLLGHSFRQEARYLAAIHGVAAGYAASHAGRRPPTLAALQAYGRSSLPPSDVRRDYLGRLGVQYDASAGDDEPLALYHWIQSTSSYVIWVTGSGDIFVARSHEWPVRLLQSGSSGKDSGERQLRLAEADGADLSVLRLRQEVAGGENNGSRGVPGRSDLRPAFRSLWRRYAIQNVL